MWIIGQKIHLISCLYSVIIDILNEPKVAPLGHCFENRNMFRAREER